MISRVLGFVRDVLIANFLGAGMIADAFFVAFKLPNLFRSLLAGCPVLYCSITALLGVYIVRSKPKTSDVI